MEKLIFHIDVNNAFLSWTAVDLLNKGYSVDIRKIDSVISGDESKRHGIILAKSSEAKKKGVKSAETLYSAKMKCPNLKVFKPNYALYKKESDKIFNYLKGMFPDVMQISIDECFIDLTTMKLMYKNPLELAKKLQLAILNNFKVTVNIGIANSYICAKMASDFEKPNKIHTLYHDEVETKMWTLSIDKLFMVGKSTYNILKNLNIHTIKDLALFDENILYKYFKNNSKILISYANGIDVEREKSIKNKSFSTSETLIKDTDDVLFLNKILLKQVSRLCVELRKENLFTSTITIIMKNTRFKTYTHQKTLSFSSNDYIVLFKEIKELFKTSWNGELIRLIGVRFSGLNHKNLNQISLFDEENDNNNEKLFFLLDKLNSKYKENIVIPASLKEETHE